MIPIRQERSHPHALIDGEVPFPAWCRLDRGAALVPGKLADIIVPGHNPMTVLIGEIHLTKVLATYIAGEKVFSASEGETK